MLIQHETDQGPNGEQNRVTEEPVITPAQPKNKLAASQCYESVESAAVKLGLGAAALRARCRRGARRIGDSIVASLGGGIVAFKFGRTWRFSFPSRP